MAKRTAVEKAPAAPKMDSVVGWSESALFGSTAFPRYNPDDLVGRKGLKIYDLMMQDEQVKAVVRFKRDAITSREFAFTFPDAVELEDAEKDRRIALFNDIVTKMRGSFPDALNYIARGMWHGFSLTEKVYTVIEHGGATYVGLAELMPRPPESFEFYVDDYGSLIKLEQIGNGRRQTLDIRKFIHYVHSPETDQWYGRSELREAYRSYYAKDVLIKFWLQYLERFGGGFAVAKRGPNSNIRANTEEFRALQAAISNIRATTGIVLPPDVELTIENPLTTDQYEKAITYHDLAIAKALLVPNLLGLSHAGGVGSYAQSQTQLEAFFWTLNADSVRLAACLNEQLFRDLGDVNFGDGIYPEFTFKPASTEHVKWVISTWKDLVAAKAVQTTAEDEEYFRKIMEMPARDDNDDDKEDENVAVDPGSALAAGQVTAMLDVIRAVAKGEITKATGEQVLLQSFPLSLEEVQALLADVEEGSLKPEPMPGQALGPDGKPLPPQPGQPPVPGQPPQPAAQGAPAKPDDDDAKPPAKPPAVNAARLVPHGKLYRATRESFTRAANRVAFAVIDRKQEDAVERHSIRFAELVAKAVARQLTDDNLAQLLDEDMSDIELLRFDAADMSRLKSEAKATLEDGWQTGATHSADELARAAGKPFKRDFKSLRGNAADYFEANGFRMAANLADGTRAIIQQELISAVKGGLGPAAAKANIYGRLIGKGFTDGRSVAQLEKDPEVIGLLRTVFDLFDEDGNPLTDAQTRAYASTLVRTNVNEAMNESRYATFTDPEVGDFVVALEYSAILDANTTSICESLDNGQWAKDSDVWDTYRPPNHYNCRSILIPITATDGWTEADESPPPDVEPQDGFGAGAK